MLPKNSTLYQPEDALTIEIQTIYIVIFSKIIYAVINC